MAHLIYCISANGVLMSDFDLLQNRNPIRAKLDGSLIKESAFCPPRPYQMCTKCIMDTTDPEIRFDVDGKCSYCVEYADLSSINTGKTSDSDMLKNLLNTIKLRSSRSKFDCVLGLSGGVDSSYLATKVSEWGLRPLVVHIDTGWNSEEAVNNIFRLVEALDFELETFVVNWSDMRNLQLAYLKSGLANLDVPQDHVIFSILCEIAKQEGIKTILSGSNLATESVLPRAWGYDAKDGLQIREIISKFSQEKLNEIKPKTLFDYHIRRPLIDDIRFVQPLNLISYRKSDAILSLVQSFAWIDYGGKHHESKWTKFFQSYLLPYRFGYDKRKAHLSSSILSGELTRESALLSLFMPLYSVEDLERDRDYISNKLEIRIDELVTYENLQLSHYADFKNGEWVKKLRNFLPKRIVRRLI